MHVTVWIPAVAKNDLEWAKPAEMWVFDVKDERQPVTVQVTMDGVEAVNATLASCRTSFPDEKPNGELDPAKYS